MTWPAYPRYKSSGVEWLGDVPSEWTVGTFAKFGRFEGGAGFPHEYQGLTDQELPFHKVNALGRATGTGVIDTRDDTVSRETARALGATVLPKGTLVFAKVGAALLLGRIATVPTEACIDNNMMAFIPSESIAPTFARYMLSQVRFDLLVNPGAVPSVNEGQMKRLPTVVPPIPEQQEIADFLDYQTAKIDALIAKQEQLIATLREDRHARLVDLVAHGVDQDAPQKASGLGWVETVSLDWKVLNIRHAAAMKTGHTPSRSVPKYWENTTIPWFTLADVWQLRDEKNIYLGDTSEQISELGLANSAAELLPAGTVVLSRTASVGFTGIMPTPMATSQDYWNWVCGPNLLPEYLMYVFCAMKGYFSSLMMGSTHKTIYQADAAAIRIPLPPLPEQQRIVREVASTMAQMDALTEKAGDLIRVLREYRSALITDAVTGKIDVRGAA